MSITEALVIHPEFRSRPSPSRKPPEMMLDEAVRLTQAIGLSVTKSEHIMLSAPVAGSFLGLGFVSQLSEAVDETSLVVINASLTPVQQRNLEEALKCKVIDRTALILEIFGERATSNAGRLQVELAALNFQRSRLVRSWTHLERQRGGSGFLGGPGERQIEIDRRLLDDRIEQIKTELKKVERTRGLQRRNRQRLETPTVALVGYTNAGKSTLFNTLTGAQTMSKDMLFATLDPLMRAINAPGMRPVILADTVGFISQLPTGLIEAFKSTLEEVTEADLLIHVHDMSSPLALEEAEDVDEVLDSLDLDIEARKACILHVFNKSDLLGEGQQDVVAALEHRYPDAVKVSALRGEGIKDLHKKIEKRFSLSEKTIKITVPYSKGSALAWLHRHSQVKAIKNGREHDQVLTVQISTANFSRFRARWPEFCARTTLPPDSKKP